MLVGWPVMSVRPPRGHTDGAARMVFEMSNAMFSPFSRGHLPRDGQWLSRPRASSMLIRDDGFIANNGIFEQGMLLINKVFDILTHTGLT